MRNLFALFKSLPLSEIAPIVTAIIAVVSAFYAKRAYCHQRDRAKKEAACNLAKFYADNIIIKYSFICNVLNQSGVLEEIKKVFPIEKLNLFDMAEYRSLCHDSNTPTDFLDEELNKIDPLIILNCKVFQISNLSDRAHTLSTFAQTNNTGNINIQNKEVLITDFQSEIINLLNTLEWFSMNCIYNLADEEIIYQSLHQTYLAMVWMLYGFICKPNTNNEDKYFSNTVKLFKLWNTRSIELKSETERERDKLLRQAEALHPEYSGKPLK